jgi:hypothetical protein
MESLALRPRKATEIVDAAIEVYRRNPIHFLLLAAIVRVPWLIVQIVFVAGRETEIQAFFTSLLIAVGAVISYFLMSGLIAQMASELYLGRETDAFRTLSQVKGRIPTVFMASVGKSIALALGLVLFLFPAVWVTALMFAVIPAIVIEQRGLFEAFSRSARMSEGVKSHILSAIGLVVIIRIVVEIGIALLSTLVTMPELRYVVIAVAGILMYPLMGIAETLIYYDIRIRKEGFDIEMMAQQATPPASSG